MYIKICDKMGFLDSITSSVENNIKSKAESEIASKASSTVSNTKPKPTQNQQTSTQTSAENAVKVTIEFKDRTITINGPSIYQSPSSNGNTNFQIIGKPNIAKK